MAKTNRCSVSISPAWTTIGLNAKITALARIENPKLDKNDRVFIYTVSEFYRERDQPSVKDNQTSSAGGKYYPFLACAVMA
jgi:hypothetical protein